MSLDKAFTMWSTTCMLVVGLAVLSAVGSTASVLENLSVTREVEVEEGGTAVLNCSVHSVPTARLLWILDGVILRQVRSNSDSLVLHNASRFHLQHVTCQATNEHFPPRFLQRATLIRIKGTYEMVAKPHLSPKDLPVLHRPFRLDCTVFDLPFHFVVERLSYTWYKDYRVIEGQSSSTLHIASMSKEDGGIYSCTARNGNIMSTSPESNEYAILVLVPPVVQIEPKGPNNTIRQAAGKNLTLTCQVTEAIPRVSTTGYSWSYLSSPQGQRRSLEARERTLTLGPLTEEDSGQYFCQARSDPDFQGELPPGNASVTVDVVYLKDIELTPDLEVNEGDHVALTCTVKCKPTARLVWTVDGREVRHVTANVDHYVVRRASCSDSKTYTCLASNEALSGLEETASTQVLVNCSQRNENDILLMPSATTLMQFPEGHNLTLTCMAEFTSFTFQRRVFTWTFSPSDSRPRQRLQETGQSLTLGPLTGSESGRYTCQAWNNPDDSGQSSIDLTVTVLNNTCMTSHILFTCLDFSLRMGTRATDCCFPGDSIKIVVPVIMAILLWAGIVGVILWRRKLRFDRAARKTPDEEQTKERESLTKETEASQV